MMPGVDMVMHLQMPPSVPAFIAKLWKMVENPDTDGLISWSEGGTSFCIKNQSEFARSLLPYYYKHSNMASFVRQLNMYDFHKVLSVEAGALKGEKEEMEFAHSYFNQGQEQRLEQIKRKVTSARTSAGFKQQFLPSLSSEKVNEVLTEVGQLKERQEDLDGRLEAMKTENEALWGEVISLRQRHSKQQKIVNKLIQFLVALVQPRGRKRPFQPRMSGVTLAIEDTGVGKVARKGEQVHMDSQQQLLQVLPLPHLSQADDLTVEHTQLSDLLITSVADEEVAELNLQTVYTMDTSVQGQEERQLSLTPSRVRTPVLHREISREDFDMNIFSMQEELENLKDLLSGQITVDTSMVSDLFGQDMDIGTMNMFNETLVDLKEGVEGEAGTKKVNLLTYSPGKLVAGQAEGKDPKLWCPVAKCLFDHDYADLSREDHHDYADLSQEEDPLGHFYA